MLQFSSNIKTVKTSLYNLRSNNYETTLHRFQNRDQNKSVTSDLTRSKTWDYRVLVASDVRNTFTNDHKNAHYHITPCVHLETSQPMTWKTNDKQPNREFEPWFTTLAELDGLYCYYWIRVLSTVDGDDWQDRIQSGTAYLFPQLQRLCLGTIEYTHKWLLSL